MRFNVLGYFLSAAMRACSRRRRADGTAPIPYMHANGYAVVAVALAIPRLAADPLAQQQPRTVARALLPVRFSRV